MRTGSPKILKWLVENFNGSSHMHANLNSIKGFVITVDDVVDVFQLLWNEENLVLVSSRRNKLIS